MTRTIVAILALSPAMLFAQTTTPAQPVSTPVLQSSLVQPAVFAEIKSADAAKAALTPVRTTTGVVAPLLLTAIPSADDQDRPAQLHVSRTAVIDLTVDATGKPTGLKVVQSSNKYFDQDALAAISQYHFKPGTLDGQPVAVPMRIKYVVKTQVNGL